MRCEMNTITQAFKLRKRRPLDIGWCSSNESPTKGRRCVPCTPQNMLQQTPTHPVLFVPSHEVLSQCSQNEITWNNNSSKSVDILPYNTRDHGQAAVSEITEYFNGKFEDYNKLSELFPKDHEENTVSSVLRFWPTMQTPPAPDPKPGVTSKNYNSQQESKYAHLRPEKRKLLEKFDRIIQNVETKDEKVNSPFVDRIVEDKKEDQLQVATQIIVTMDIKDSDHQGGLGMNGDANKSIYLQEEDEFFTKDMLEELMVMESQYSQIMLSQTIPSSGSSSSSGSVCNIMDPGSSPHKPVLRHHVQMDSIEQPPPPIPAGVENRIQNFGTDSTSTAERQRENAQQCTKVLQKEVDYFFDDDEEVYNIFTTLPDTCLENAAENKSVILDDCDDDIFSMPTQLHVPQEVACANAHSNILLRSKENDKPLPWQLESQGINKPRTRYTFSITGDLPSITCGATQQHPSESLRNYRPPVVTNTDKCQTLNSLHPISDSRSAMASPLTGQFGMDGYVISSTRTSKPLCSSKAIAEKREAALQRRRQKLERQSQSGRWHSHSQRFK